MEDSPEERFSQLSIQFEEYKLVTKEIQTQSENALTKAYAQVEKLARTCQQDKRNYQKNTEKLTKQVELYKKQAEEMKAKQSSYQARIVALQNEQDQLQSDSRAQKQMILLYQDKIQSTVEELAMVRTQLQHARLSENQAVQRLTQQIKQRQESLTQFQARQKQARGKRAARRPRALAIIDQLLKVCDRAQN